MKKHSVLCMVVIAQLLVSNLEAQLVSQQPAGKATKYETELGTLYEGVSIEKGAEISFGTSGNMEIIFGFMGLSSSNAFPVGADLRVFTAHSVTNKPQVTLVQDKAT